jgi:hypothetical protein
MLALNKEIMVDTALFRSLSARITAAVIFIVLVVMMIYGQLPYQLPLNPNKAPIVKPIHQIIAILSTCSLILFFFIPTKKMAVYTTIVMVLLLFSYGSTLSYYGNYMLWVALVPFCRANEGMFSQIKFHRILPPCFIAVGIFEHGTKIFESFATILYIIPYLPFERITNWVSNQLEPR